MDEKFQPSFPGKQAFLSALHDGDLKIRGDFVAVMWFQGLTEFLQSPKSGTLDHTKPVF